MNLEDPPRAAIRVKQDDRAQKMDPLARLLWSRPYRVMANVKAYGFGKVHKESRASFEMRIQDLGMKVLVDRPPPRDIQTPESDYVEQDVIHIDRTPSFPMFQVGDPVVLLIQKQQGHTQPPLRNCRIMSQVYSEPHWQYSLRYDTHDGRYLQGRLFNEGLLMRRFMA